MLAWSYRKEGCIFGTALSIKRYWLNSISEIDPLTNPLPTEGKALGSTPRWTFQKLQYQIPGLLSEERADTLQPSSLTYKQSSKPNTCGFTSCGFGSWILISSAINSVMKHIASFPGLLHLTWSIKKWREKAFRIVPRDPQHGYYRCHHTSQQPLSCTRPILHSVLATKIGQALAESYTECIKQTQAKSHDSKRTTEWQVRNLTCNDTITL